MLKPNFQEQVDIDRDAVFFNKEAMEFVTTHTIGGIRGKPPAVFDIVTDRELYSERNVKDNVENISLDGVVIFVKADDWKVHFGSIPQIESVLKLDGEEYLIIAVNDDMGIYEITLSGTRG